MNSSMLRILGYGLAVIGSAGLGAGMYVGAKKSLTERPVAVSSTMLTSGTLPSRSPEPSREIPGVDEVTPENVISIAPVVITVPRRRIPQNRVAVRQVTEPSDSDGDVLHAAARHWTCQVRESAFGGQVRVCGSDERLSNTR